MDFKLKFEFEKDIFLKAPSGYEALRLIKEKYEDLPLKDIKIDSEDFLYEKISYDCNNPVIISFSFEEVAEVGIEHLFKNSFECLLYIVGESEFLKSYVSFKLEKSERRPLTIVIRPVVDLKRFVFDYCTNKSLKRGDTIDLTAETESELESKLSWLKTLKILFGIEDSTQ